MEVRRWKSHVMSVCITKWKSRDGSDEMEVTRWKYMCLFLSQDVYVSVCVTRCICVCLQNLYSFKQVFVIKSQVSYKFQTIKFHTSFSFFFTSNNHVSFFFTSNNHASNKFVSHVSFFFTSNNHA